MWILPVYDGITFANIRSSNKIAIVLGKFQDKYVISLGWSTVLTVHKQVLKDFKQTNWYFDSSGKLRLKHGRLKDLSEMFKNDTAQIIDTIIDMADSSSGQQSKAYGTSGDLYGILKYPISIDSKDIEYEVLYYIVGKQLGIPVVRAKIVVVAGRKCVISVFEYDKRKEEFITFYDYIDLEDISEYELLKRLDPDDLKKYSGYLVLDYIMNQGDRHLRNLGLVDGKLYPLYDNGRCLTMGIGESSRHRQAVLKNIKSWYNTNKYVKGIIDRYGKVRLPDNYIDEKQIMDCNYNELRRIING